MLTAPILTLLRLHRCHPRPYPALIPRITVPACVFPPKSTCQAKYFGWLRQPADSKSLTPKKNGVITHTTLLSLNKRSGKPRPPPGLPHLTQTIANFLLLYP